MTAPIDPLDALAELERRYNGPVPEPLRLVAQYGCAEKLRSLQAEGQAAFFKSMVRGQIATIRRRRADGSFYPALLEDLVLYRRQWRRWHILAHRLRPSISTAHNFAHHAYER